MPSSMLHDDKNLLDKSKRNFFMKKIAHRINKDEFGLLPPQRHIQSVFMLRHLKSVNVFWDTHCFQTPGHSFSVAELAAWAYFAATRSRIPGCLCPFNG